MLINQQRITPEFNYSRQQKTLYQKIENPLEL